MTQQYQCITGSSLLVFQHNQTLIKWNPSLVDTNGTYRLSRCPYLRNKWTCCFSRDTWMSSPQVLIFQLCDVVQFDIIFMSMQLIQHSIHLIQEERGEPSEQLLEVLHSDESVHPSSNLLNDGVILPQETRQVWCRLFTCVVIVQKSISHRDPSSSQLSLVPRLLRR